MTIIFAFLAFSVDIGYMVVTDSELQNAADSAALSGARALPSGDNAAIQAARRWANQNTAAGRAVVVTEQDIAVGLWDEETASFRVLPPGSDEVPNAVRVSCHRAAARGNALNLFCAPVIGTNSADLMATATAKIERDICGLFVGLRNVDVQNGTVDSYHSAQGAYGNSVGDNGDVCSNGPITLSPQGRVRGDARPGKGYSVNRPDQVTGSTDSPKHKIRWQNVDRKGPAESNNNDAIPEWALTNDEQRIVVEGQNTLELPPGTYYLPKGLRIAGKGKLVITGPTKLVLGGDVSVAGNGCVNTTTVPANLRIEMFSKTARFAGNAALQADVYAPTTRITVAGNAGFYGGIFAESISMEGSNAAMHGDQSLRETFDSYTSRVSLRQ